MKDSELRIAHWWLKKLKVDVSKTLKRIQPAPQGRAHRIKKRSNHVTIVIGSPVEVEEKVQEQVTENQA